MSEIFVTIAFCMCIMNALVIGFIMGRGSVDRKGKKAVSSHENDLSEEELEAIRKEREELKAQQEAFVRLMGYNADIAYGLDQSLQGS